MLSEFAETYAAQGDTAKRDESARKSLAMVEQLSKGDPGNLMLQGNLAIAYEKVGSTLWQAGDLDKALENYRASQAIFERVAKAEPKNPVWQRAVSTTYERVGDVLMAEGNVAQALASYEASFDLAKKVAGAVPDNSDLQRDLAYAHAKVGDAYRSRGISNPRSSGTRRPMRSSLAWRRPIHRIPAGRATSAFRMRDSGTSAWPRAIYLRRSKATRLRKKFSTA